MTAVPIDLDGLLCALVLAPRTFARNRFYWLFTQTDARRVRSRATQLRTIVRHLAGKTDARGEVVEHRDLERGGLILVYRVRTLGLTRTATLDPLEASLVRFALHQAGANDAADGWQKLTDLDRASVEGALGKLGDHLVMPAQTTSISPQPNSTSE